MDEVRPRGRRRSDSHTLIAAALELFRDRGYDSATIDQIAQRAGVSKASIYARFASKEDLLAQGVTPLVHSLLAVFDEAAATTGDHTSRLAHVLRNLVRTALQRSSEASVLVRLQSGTATGRELLRIRKEFERRVIALVEDGVRAGEFRSDIAPPLAARLLLSLSNWLSVWYRPDGRWTAEELADLVVSIALQGIVTDLDGMLEAQ